MKHFDELLIYMQDKPFDILTLNETRLDNSISDSEVKIPGYDIPYEKNTWKSHVVHMCFTCSHM